jgi:outer membrane protein, heavy metal efflux system
VSARHRQRIRLRDSFDAGIDRHNSPKRDDFLRRDQRRRPPSRIRFQRTDLSPSAHLASARDFFNPKNTSRNMMRLIATLAVAFTGVLLVSIEGAAQESMTLDGVYREVRAHSPRLQAGSAIVAARTALEAGAGLPPDPQVEIAAMNLSLPRLSAAMPTSMLPSITVMQMLPLFGKLRLGRRIAQQSTQIAQTDVDEAWWEIRAEAAMAYYEIYRADGEIAVMTETLALLQDFGKVAQAMYSAGEGRQADVLRAGVEVARMEADIKRMQAMRTAAAGLLNALANKPAGNPTGTPVLPALPLDIPSVDTLKSWADSARPMLARGRLEIDQAASQVDLARKEILPDITVGIQYGQRRAQMAATDPGMPADYETERMGSVMLGFSVPVFAGRRQLKMREEAEAMRQMAQSDLARMRAQVDARIVALVADLDRNRTLVQLYRTDVLPQAEANVQSAFSSYRVGQVDFMTLVDAQMTANKYKQEIVAMLAGYGVAIAELEMTVGRELPIGVVLRAGGN